MVSREGDHVVTTLFAALRPVEMVPSLTSPVVIGLWKAQILATTLSLRIPNKASSAQRWKMVSDT